MPNVFISYSHTDAVFARKLYNDLTNKDVKVWIDKVDIWPGDMWDKKVTEGIDWSTHVLLILSPEAAASNEVLNEIFYARQQKLSLEQKEIIPLLLLDCNVPLHITRMHYIDFREDYESAFNALLGRIALSRHPATPANTNDRSRAGEAVNDPGQAVLETDEENLFQLAAMLAQNHVASSFPRPKALRPMQTILKQSVDIKEEKRTRNILIVGEGCSNAVSDDIPLFSEAIRHIWQQFEEKYKYDAEKKERVVEKARRIIEQNHLEANSFEAQLVAMSSVDKQLVLEKLNDLYNLRYPVSLFYEIVGHLFKHRFLDVIINFNIDEMLDRVVDEEKGESDFAFINSDGVIISGNNILDSQEELLLNQRLKMPVYIKPNGTISHPSTLRFTKKDYFEQKSKLKEVITSIIHGEIDKHTHLDINLVVTGFEFNNSELNTILNEQKKSERIKLFYFDRTTKTQFEKRKNKFVHSQALFSSLNSFFFQVKKSDDDLSPTLHDWFYALWGKIMEQFNDEFRPKEISRHVVIHELFTPIAETILNPRKQPRSYRGYGLKEYFKDRVYAELAIELLNSNDGIINLKQLAESRVGRYFSLLKKEDNEASLFRFLTDFELQRYKGFLVDTWWFDVEDKNFKKKVVRKASTFLSEKVKLNLPDDSKTDHRFWLAVKQLREKKSLFLNIQTRSRDAHLSIFQELTSEAPLTTDVKWTYTFKKYFLMRHHLEEWNLVLAISETGGIFTEQKIKDALVEKKMMLICSYNGMIGKEKRRAQLLQGKLKDIQGALLRNQETEELRMIPFRAHNQHIVLFAKVDPIVKAITLYKGIYYNRRAMTKSVSPLHISQPKDLDALMDIFLNYWDRSRTEDENDLIRTMVDRIRTEDTERAFSNLKRELIILRSRLHYGKRKEREELISEIVDLYSTNSK